MKRILASASHALSRAVVEKSVFHKSTAAILAALLFLGSLIVTAPRSFALESDLLQSETLQSEVLSDNATAVSEMVQGKSSSDAANIKGREIVDQNISGTFTRNGIKMQIESIEAIDGGIQVFARAWKGGKQIGFGPDGSVDIERFRIFNPPILVPDGTFSDEIVEWGNDKVTHSRVPNYKEDLKEAVLLTLAHTISTVAKDGSRIIAGKHGNTTDTFYPSHDGRVMNDFGSGTSFSTVRNGSGNSADTDNSPRNTSYDAHSSSNQFYRLDFLIFIFDTAALPDSDVISNATFSAVANDKYTDWSESLNVTAADTSSDTAISNSDYEDTIGNLDTKLSSDKSISSLDTGGSTYSDWTFNSSGTSTINVSGITKLALRTATDIDNGSPAGWTSFGSVGARFLMTANTGTTNDPKLVVAHYNPSNVPTAPTSLQTNGQTNPSNLSASAPEFSAIYNDPNTSDSAVSYKIQVATTSTFASTYWDSGKTTLASSTAQGTRIDDITYGGAMLASSTTYYWRIKFWDSDDAEGAWSTATSTFSLAASNPSKVRKSANESVTSSTALQSDDELRLVLTASTTYIVEGVVFASSTSGTPGIKIGFTVPTGATLTVGYTTDADNVELTSSNSAGPKIAVASNEPRAILVKGTVVTSGTGGDLVLRWAQGTSNANATVVAKGSYLKVDPI